MIGPHYQRLAQAQRQITGKQMLQRIQSHTNNPLTIVIDKLKKQFLEYETAYTDDIINSQISSVDRLLSFDGKLGPILAGLEKQNNLLRKQLSLLQSQLSNSVSICEHIITQNNQLKETIIQKNQDISKIIETIATNQSQARNQLQDKVAILQQQNSILISHLEQIKKMHLQFTQELKQKNTQIQNSQRKYTQTKKHLSETLNRERQITRKLAIAQHLLFEEKEKRQVIDNQCNMLTLENSELKAKITLLEGTKQSFDPQALRKSIQNQYITIIEEHKALKNQRQELLRQLEKTKLEKEKIQNVLNQWERKSNKLISDSQMRNNLLIAEKEKTQTLSSTLKKLEQKLQELRQQNMQLKVQNEGNTASALVREKALQRQIQDLRKQIHERSTEMERKLKELKQKSSQLLDSKDQEIKRLNEINTELRRTVDRQR